MKKTSPIGFLPPWYYIVMSIQTNQLNLNEGLYSTYQLLQDWLPWISWPCLGSHKGWGPMAPQPPNFPSWPPTVSWPAGHESCASLPALLIHPLFTYLLLSSIPLYINIFLRIKHRDSMVLAILLNLATFLVSWLGRYLLRHWFDPSPERECKTVVVRVLLIGGRLHSTAGMPCSCLAPLPDPVLVGVWGCQETDPGSSHFHWFRSIV